jgi:hypothetical protein
VLSPGVGSLQAKRALGWGSLVSGGLCKHRRQQGCDRTVAVSRGLKPGQEELSGASWMHWGLRSRKDGGHRGLFQVQVRARVRVCVCVCVCVCVYV